MLIAASISMWVTNTATTMMLLPVILSVIALLADRQGESRATHHFALCLLLGTAYAATIGGVGTIVGTAPNVFVVSFLQSQYDLQISFAGWMAFAVPLVLLFLPLCWWLLTRVVYPLDLRPVEGVAGMVRASLRELGPLSRAERRVAVVFFVTVALWMTRPLLQDLPLGDLRPLAGLNDSAIAIAAALSLFIVPDGRGRGGRLLDWESAARIPWGLLILFGGGLSLGSAMDRYGVSGYLGALATSLGGLPVILILVGILTLVIFLTELTRNTATTATLVPILAAIAPALGLAPWELTVPAAIAASFAFMLPVATPPNAIVFGSGQVSIAEMARAGFWLNLLGIASITLITWLVIMPMLRA
jgi:sodium-dependent dicarboxylate transporter 2/3/5